MEKTRSDFEERLDALKKKYQKKSEQALASGNEVAQEALAIFREWVEARGRLIIFLRDELTKVSDLNEHLADTLEAVCAENEHLARKLARVEEKAARKAAAEHAFHVGAGIARMMSDSKTFFERRNVNHENRGSY